MSAPKFQMLDEVQCIVSGLKGKIGAVTEWDVGEIRYGVQPAAKEDGTLPEGYDIDESQLELVKEGPEGKRRAAFQKPFKYNFGDDLRDKISGYTGKVVYKAEYLNGCFKYGLQGKYNEKEQKLPQMKTFFEQNLEVVVANPKPVAPEVKRATGGPMTKSIR
jgi:hypothetical protein